MRSNLRRFDDDRFDQALCALPLLLAAACKVTKDPATIRRPSRSTRTRSRTAPTPCSMRPPRRPKSPRTSSRMPGPSSKTAPRRSRSAPAASRTRPKRSAIDIEARTDDDKPANARRALRERPPLIGAAIVERRGVAQPGSASALGAEGRRFESCLPDHSHVRADPGDRLAINRAAIPERLCRRPERWWARRESNPQPSRYERPALPLSYRPSPLGHAGRMSRSASSAAQLAAAQGLHARAKSGAGQLAAGSSRTKRRGIDPQVAARDPRQAAHQPQREADARACRRRRSSANAGSNNCSSLAAVDRRGRVMAERAHPFSDPMPEREALRRGLAASTTLSTKRRTRRSASSGSSAQRWNLPSSRVEIAGAARRRRRPRTPRSGAAECRRNRFPSPGPARLDCSLAAKSRSSIALKQRPRLADDLGGALAIAAVRRPEILAVDDFGETDDRVQRRLDLVDQLAQRIMVGRRRRWHGAGRRRHRFLAARDPAIAGEAAVGGLERGHAADPPAARQAGRRRQATSRRRGTGCAARRRARPHGRPLPPRRCRQWRSSGRSARRAARLRPRRFRPTGRIPSGTRRANPVPRVTKRAGRRVGSRAMPGARMRRIRSIRATISLIFGASSAAASSGAAWRAVRRGASGSRPFGLGRLAQFGMDGFGESACFVADSVEHHVPFRRIEPRSGDHRRGNGQAVGGEDRDQSATGRLQTGDGARGGGAQLLGQESRGPRRSAALPASPAGCPARERRARSGRPTGATAPRGRADRRRFDRERSPGDRRIAIPHPFPREKPLSLKRLSGGPGERGGGRR